MVVVKVQGNCGPREAVAQDMDAETNQSSAQGCGGIDDVTSPMARRVAVIA